MVFVLADRVQEITTTTGTGTITLGGALVQFTSFGSAIGTGNTTWYCITSGDGVNWEVGLGTIGGTGPYTLARTTIYASSNSGSTISLSGTSTVYCDLPASKISLGGGGGYAPGTTPTFVQFASDGSSSGTIVFGTAPVSGNLLLCITSGTGYPSANTGWTSVASNGGGSDNLYIWSKVAGTSESATQTPVTGAINGGLAIWEIHGQNATTPILSAVGQAENNGANPQIAPQAYNIPGVIGLSAMFSQGVSHSRVVNTGTVDAMVNAGTRYIAAGHGTLGDSVFSGLYVFYTGNTNAKGATVQITV